MNPNPDYDASDELEYGVSAFAWLLRGVYPRPLTHRTSATPAGSYCGGGTYFPAELRNCQSWAGQ